MAAQVSSDPVDLSHIDVWIFDLDNTLYPARCNLFAQIDQRMTAFIESYLGMAKDDARRLQKRYYVEHGTTLNGLMRENGVAPGDFLEYVHDIDLSLLEADPALARHINALPGEKYVFTNGSVAHAENVMEKLGLAELFDAVHDIEAGEFLPKPHADAYERFLKRHDLKASAAIMFEDLPQNLIAPHDLGMTTVLVQSDAPWIENEPVETRPSTAGEAHAHVHHAIEDIAEFLARVRHSAHVGASEKG
ncbi:MAG: pyrimidine 5'-nucleotidase [Pseudomonadota bacterium]